MARKGSHASETHAPATSIWGHCTGSELTARRAHSRAPQQLREAIKGTEVLLTLGTMPLQAPKRDEVGVTGPLYK